MYAFNLLKDNSIALGFDQGHFKDDFQSVLRSLESLSVLCFVSCKTSQNGRISQLLT